MRIPKKAGLLLLMFAAAAFPLTLAACKDCGGGSSGTSPSASTSSSGAPTTSVASASASASGSSARRGGPQVRASGAAGAIFRATHGLDLSTDQKSTIEKIGEDLRAGNPAAAGGGDGGAAPAAAAGDGGANPRAEMKEAHADLINGVKAGKLDMAKLDAHQAAIDKATKARMDRELEALNKLHGTLQPEQRAKVVSNIKAAEEKRANRMKAHDKPDAGKPNFAKMRFEHYTRDLDLSDDQKKKVEGLLPKEDKTDAMREDNKKVLEATLAAFEKEGFDAKKLPQPDPKKKMQPFADLAKFFNGLLPVLKPEQRDKLAAKLEKPSGGSGRGGPHRGGGRGGWGDSDHEQQEEDDETE
jgi:Spy/CpxP family protein refolding chaperone